MSLIALLIALPVALAGGWYLVNPNAAARLERAEGRPANAMRIRLRRVNGVLMVLAGLALYFAISRTLMLSPDEGRRPGLLLPLAWIALVPLAMGMLVLAWLDMRLTRRMRRKYLQDLARSGTSRAAPALLLMAALMLGGCDQSETNPPAQTPVQPASMNPPASPTPRSNASARQDPPPASQPGTEGQTPQKLPTTRMSLGGEEFTLQVANAEAERKKGLMWVTELGPNAGMIFVFREPDWLGFWMQNTLIPLDLIFVTDTGRVTNVEGGQVRSLRSIESAGRAKYVIEIARGRAAKLGIARGTALEMPQGIDEGVE